MYNVPLKPEKKMDLIVRMIFKVKFVENNCKEWKSLTTPNLNIEISALHFKQRQNCSHCFFDPFGFFAEGDLLLNCNYYFIFMTAIYNLKNQKTVVWKSGREEGEIVR